MNFLPKIDTPIDKKLLENMPVLNLSLIGDAVHTLYVRATLLKENPYADNGTLHSLTSKSVKASSQSEMAKKITPFLQEEEAFIFRKAINSKVNNVPKNCTLYTYHLSTAFEAVVGYLYLSAQHERLMDLLNIIKE